MLKILPISGEYLFVIAEDIVDFSQSAIVRAATRRNQASSVRTSRAGRGRLRLLNVIIAKGLVMLEELDALEGLGTLEKLEPLEKTCSAKFALLKQRGFRCGWTAIFRGATEMKCRLVR